MMEAKWSAGSLCGTDIWKHDLLADPIYIWFRIFQIREDCKIGINDLNIIIWSKYLLIIFSGNIFLQLYVAVLHLTQSSTHMIIIPLLVMAFIKTYSVLSLLFAHFVQVRGLYINEMIIFSCQGHCRYSHLSKMIT